MGDALDILNVKPAAPKLKQPFKTRAPENSAMNREIQALGSKPLPSMAPTLSFKEKRQRGAPVRWESKAFTNSARGDGLKLIHWQKAGVQWDDYPFARFNKKVQFQQYTQDEYARHFTSSDWSREETDRLFDLCRQYDMRFIIIQDRMATKRSVEDLKDRFYTIQRKLLQLQELQMGVSLADNPLMQRAYNKEYEVDRKAQLERLYHRSREVEEREEKLLAEARKILQAQKKKEKEKKRALEVAKQKSKKEGETIIPMKTEEELTKPGGCCLRSELMRSEMDIAAKSQAKVDVVLGTLGLGAPSASAATHGSYVNLRASIAVLLEWQKFMQKKKYEYDNYKLRKAELSRPNTATKTPGKRNVGDATASAAKRAKK